MAVSKIFTAPSVHITPIPLSLLRFPPAGLPSTVPPPTGEPTLSHPFSIPPDVYNAPLSVYVPITAALIYATSVTILDRYNAKRNFEPWPISKTRAFSAFVIGHNIFLALFSAVTFVGLLNAVTTSLDGVITEHGWVGMVDTFCKINGPRGLGDAVTFNSSTSTWGFTNRLLRLGVGETPDTTDIGRIWNEGLAFYGWFFYLSKFYEVVDTLIILAKGKKTSFLQTYHHAGAMMCMWAGIRYMAPPIWMFVLVNSFIHVLMYTYYTATASGVKVPKHIKQLITTMQIVQFLVGASFALAHLFISYTIPVSVPYIYSFADLTSGIASDLSSAASIATASASAGLGSWLKKVAFRAAGEEGLAENIRNEQGQTFGIEAIHAAKDLKAREETRYRDEFRMIHCTDTSGQVFAILINCFYLAPLTWLFAQFFIRSYLKRGERQQGMSSQLRSVQESGKEAAKEVRRELDQALNEEPGNVLDQDGKKQTSNKEKMAKTDKQDNGKEGTEDPKKNGKEGTGDSKKNGKESSDSNQDQNMDRKNKGQEDNKGDAKVDGKGKGKERERGDGKADGEGNAEADGEADIKGAEKGDVNGDEKKDVDGNERRDAKGDRKNDGEGDEKDDDKRDEKGAKKTDDNDGGDANGDRGPEAKAEDEDEYDDEDKEDIEILESAEAVADVLDTAAKDANKFSKDLKNSKAG